MVHVEDVLLTALGQSGKPYVFGAEADPLDPMPHAFDCSELVEWACARCGVQPRVPDGAYYQWLHTNQRGVVLTVAKALTTRGALLFAGSGRGVGRDAIDHVAWSLGDGTTIEARGRAWGVGTWAAKGRFSFAGLLPGIDYAPRFPVWPHEQEGLLMVVAKDAHDARDAFVRTECHRYWGHPPTSVEELNLLIHVLATAGAAACIAAIEAHERTGQLRERRGW